MFKSAASTVMWVGRATIFLVGLAVILALFFGAASTALAANGKPFLLGKKNVAKAVSTLVNQGPGPALSLMVKPGQPPLKVNSDKKVANLNADKLDNLDQSAFLRTNGKATDADKLYGRSSEGFYASGSKVADADNLDGKDSTDFAPKAVEAWHEIGSPGEPTFQNFWGNGSGSSGGGPFSTAAFYKDPYGVVHLKGLVLGPSPPSVIFSLPCGYGPAREEWHMTYSRGADGSDVPGRADIRPTLCGDGSYSANVVASRGFTTPFSLDGITFRAAGNS